MKKVSLRELVADKIVFAILLAMTYWLWAQRCDLSEDHRWTDRGARLRLRRRAIRNLHGDYRLRPDGNARFACGNPHGFVLRYG